MRFGIRAKFSLLFSLLAVAIVLGMSVQLNSLVQRTTMKQYGETLVQLLTVTRETLELTPEEVRRYGDEGKTDARYFEIADKIHTIQEETNITYLYVIYQNSETSASYMFDGEYIGENVVLGTPIASYMEEAFDATRETFSTGEVYTQLDVTHSEFGYLASALLPLKDEQGKTIAILGADVQMAQIIQDIHQQSIQMILGALVIILLGVVAMVIALQRVVLVPIANLSNAVQRMGEGELGVTVDISHNDELGDIAGMFNRMLQSVQATIAQMSTLNQTYQRFVPDELFHMLGYTSISKVKLGDNTSQELTVMSMQMNDIDSLRRQLDSKALYNLINRMLAVSIPEVTRYGGVIERFQNGGIQAFYRQQVESAIESAIGVCCRMNQAQNRTMRVTFGLSYGSVMVGVVGQENRMDQVTFSEQKVLADYLQEIAEQYSASILVSGSVIDGLSDAYQYHNRFLGYVYIRSQNRIEKVYDIFDGDTEDRRSIKTATKSNFERGVRLYAAGAYQEARRYFVEVLKHSRQDSAARVYLDLCTQHPEDEIRQEIRCFETL